MDDRRPPHAVLFLFIFCVQDGATEEGSNSTTAAALAAGAATTTPADEGAASGEGGLPPFQDRLVEESGILGGQEIFLEDVRSEKLVCVVKPVPKRCVLAEKPPFVAVTVNVTYLCIWGYFARPHLLVNVCCTDAYPLPYLIL